MLATKQIDDVHKKLLQYIAHDICIDGDCDIPIYSPNGRNITKNVFRDKKVLILSGGGIKGIAFIGALKALCDNKCLDAVTTFVGTSVGTIIILLYIIGYSPDELHEFIMCFDLAKLKCIDPLLFLTGFGLDDGTRISKTLHKFLNGRKLNPNITFKELYTLTKKKFVTIAVNLNNMTPIYMSYETHPDLPVCIAVRMSISIPFIFAPVLYEGNLYIDGGCIDNFAIHMYKDQIDDVLGICLVETVESKNNIKNLEEYIMAVIRCIISGITFNSIKDFKKNIIQIDVPQTDTINFDITTEIKSKLFDIGFNTVCEKIGVPHL